MFAAPGTCRLIPAHAGSTPRRHRDVVNPWAHPRSRGEHSPTTVVGMSGIGSSPLTRGARSASTRRGEPGRAHPRSRGEHELTHRFDSRADRLIPAHAGSTGRSSAVAPSDRAHPRSRGEHLVGTGIIFRRGAHPRSRGEHQAVIGAISRIRGSSPLTRGALCSCGHSFSVTGLIPAHAGSTFITVVLAIWFGAHPRSRGEHVLGLALNEHNVGSSPLTRGAPSPQLGDIAKLGLIPAHAGSTTILSETIPPGSSPLTRGALARVRLVITQIGLIPAHAGSTVFGPAWGS